MKERPILFSTPMVHAILARAKKQTRRVLKVPRSMHPFDGDFDEKGHPEACAKVSGCLVPIRCPYGKVGDRLWVRESFAPNYFDGRTAYMADFDELALGSLVKRPKWTPSIYMRRTQSRITLDVLGVRVERLHDISHEDAIAEGVFSMSEEEIRAITPRRRVWKRGPAVARYECLWRAINGARSWRSNPWVWVVEFARVGG